MVDLGINTVCPETIYGGYAIYPNAHADLAQNPYFAGWDPMAELVRLCKKYDLKLVPWVWVFFVEKERSPLVRGKADWLAVSRKGEHASQAEKSYYFSVPPVPMFIGSGLRFTKVFCKDTTLTDCSWITSVIRLVYQWKKDFVIVTFAGSNSP